MTGTINDSANQNFSAGGLPLTTESGNVSSTDNPTASGNPDLQVPPVTLNVSLASPAAEGGPQEQDPLDEMEKSGGSQVKENGMILNANKLK